MQDRGGVVKAILKFHCEAYNHIIKGSALEDSNWNTVFLDSQVGDTAKGAARMMQLSSKMLRDKTQLK